LANLLRKECQGCSEARRPSRPASRIRSSGAIVTSQPWIQLTGGYARCLHESRFANGYEFKYEIINFPLEIWSYSSATAEESRRPVRFDTLNGFSGPEKGTGPRFRGRSDDRIVLVTNALSPVTEVVATLLRCTQSPG
jgi:hypothetical protein